MANVNDLLYHLKQCPEELLQPSVVWPGGIIHTHALLADMFRKMSGDFTITDALLPAINDLKRFDQNQLLSMHIACWLLDHPTFHHQPLLVAKINTFLFQELPEISLLVQSRDWIEDEDRAEEFIRLTLFYCDITPEGETIEEAADRFDSLSTLNRQMVLKASTEQMRRIKEIRQRMAEQKAREAANVYGRE